MAKRKRKDPHALALSRKAAEARRRKIPPEVRSALARAAAQARWASRRKRGEE
jgi:hypothetical protein